MTFEDFIEKERPWSKNLHQIEQYRLIWNAAIKAAQYKLTQEQYFIWEPYDYSPANPELELEELKSS